VEVAKLQLEVSSTASKAQETETEVASQRRRLEAAQEEVARLSMAKQEAASREQEVKNEVAEARGQLKSANAALQDR